MRTQRWCVAVVLVVVWVGSVYGQEPIDLFSDRQPLSTDYIRIGAWNVQHFRLNSRSRALLPGDNDDDDFKSLVATYAKAIQDLQLDVVALVEHQRLPPHPTNRLELVAKALNGGGATPWKQDETHIAYRTPNSVVANLQFGVLWNSAKVEIKPADNKVLLQLRQPSSGDMLRMRAPWLVPIKVKNGGAELDMIVLHLKSGGSAPQVAEIDALVDFLRDRLAGPSPRHTLVCGDWNIRPDKDDQRGRFNKMMVPTAGKNLMRVVTVEHLPFGLDDWDRIAEILALVKSQGTSAHVDVLSRLLPRTHVRQQTNHLYTFLDHMAISRTLDEVFEHPLRIERPGGGGTKDLVPGIEVVRPLIAEAQFNSLTDHYPVVLTLRVAGVTSPGAGLSGLRIVAAMPDPDGVDANGEEVHLRNFGTTPVKLTGWKLRDASQNGVWLLDDQDGTVQPGAKLIVKRRRRSMALNNRDGDTIRLIDKTNKEVDRRSYTKNVVKDEVLTFP